MLTRRSVLVGTLALLAPEVQAQRPRSVTVRFAVGGIPLRGGFV